MSFLSVEIWRPRTGCQAEYDDMIRQWLIYIRAHRGEMPREWKWGRYLREVDRNTGEPTGCYVVLAEYGSRQEYLDCQKRIRDGSEPHAESNKLNPRQFVEQETRTVELWTPNKDIWAGWRPTSSESLIDVSTWEPLAEKQKEHDDLLREWFAYVVAHHAALFREWNSLQFYRHLDRTTGQSNGRLTALFEFNSWQGYADFKARRASSPEYKEYLSIDPHIYFDPATDVHSYWQPWEFDLWSDFQHLGVMD